MTAVRFAADRLGAPAFRAAHGVRYAYVAGGMYKAIASVELVSALGRAGLLGFFGTGGLAPEAIEDAVVRLGAALGDRPWGMNLLASADDPALELATVERYLRHGVRCVEASAYIELSLALVRYHVAGLGRGPDGAVVRGHRIIAKLSRGEVAERFLAPAPAELVAAVVERGWATAEQAALARRVPVAEDVCVEADSAGHTDAGNAYVLMPALRGLAARLTAAHGYATPVRVGAAGGIGTPEAALAAFMLGADFIATGSINQCTVEAGTSDAVKDLLQDVGVHDTGYAPSGDMFEIGARMQVVKKGVLFPARAQKLYELYLRHAGLDELDAKTRGQLEDRYFRRSLDAVWDETRGYLARRHPARLAAIERSPKQKLAAIFRWYFVHSTRVALAGSAEHKVDYQVHCGPALGAFNAWVRGTPLEPWRARHVAAIAEQLMQGTAALVGERFAMMNGTPQGVSA